MAGHTVNSVTSAVTSEVTSRVFSRLIQRYGKDVATREKLQRLEMLLIKIHSAVEASEKRTIKNSWLVWWRDKLKEAASQGDNVLANFQQQAQDSQASSNTNKGSQQQGEAVSSSVSAPSKDVSAPSFTRNSLSDMVQDICNATNMLFCTVDDDMEKLNRTLGSLEKLSPDIGLIRLLHLEALPSAKAHGPTEKMGETRKRGKKRTKHSATHSNPTSGPFFSSEPPPEEEKLENLPYPMLRCIIPIEPQFMLLLVRLVEACDEIDKAVELADSHDLEELAWLEHWTGILREAKVQGDAVLGTTSARETFNKEDELGSFVHRLEGLARDVEYFSKLVHLCPAW